MSQLRRALFVRRAPLALALVAVCAAPLVQLRSLGAAASPAGDMAAAARRWLDALDPEQRRQAVFSWDDPRRLEWHYVPKARDGLPWKRMTAAQRKLAQAFLEAGLGQAGRKKTREIIELESVLAVLESNPVKRDPELYYFSVFGEPGPTHSWGWRVEGHHVSLNFTIVAGKLLATTPAFLGANPAEVRQGALKGRRALGAEEDLGRALVASFDDEARAKVIFAKEAPAEIVTAAASKVNPLAPAGLAASSFSPAQKRALRDLLTEYASTMPAPLAAERMARLERAGFDKIHFAWAGSLKRGEPHYYRVQGPTFLVEYDNTQNGANHVHTVWRDFAGDFGRDLIREHLARTPH
jgi:hypothetical protein